MIRLVVLLLVGLPLLVLGGEGLIHAARNREQQVMTCEQFARERPTVAWVRLTACDTDYIGAAYRQWRGRVVELLFPLRPLGTSRSTPAFAIVATRDPRALAIAQRTIGPDKRPDQESLLVMMLTIVTELKAAREIAGYARMGILDVLDAPKLVAPLEVPIDRSFVIIDLHRRPPLLVPALQAATGVQALAVALYLHLVRRRRRTASTRTGVAAGRGGSGRDDAREGASAPDVAVAAALSPQPAAGRLRGIMLLNLPADAALDAIEDAPPLGSRSDVLRTLNGLLPGVYDDASGQWTCAAVGYGVTITIGRLDPVMTAIIADARGDGAVAAVQAILTATGWRAFAVRRGAFVAPDDLQAACEP